jgi:cell division protease FtsH
VAEKIDQEVRQLVNDAFAKAKQTLLDYRTQLDAVATRLIEVETINREEFESIFPPPFPKKSGTPTFMHNK